MNKELQLWQFVARRLKANQTVMLLVVVDSSGSSPGRAGYKMAIAYDGEIIGSIGGGIMEVNLVEQGRSTLSEPPALAGGLTYQLNEQVHQKNKPNSSGMICSGKQTVIFRLLSPEHAIAISAIINAFENHQPRLLTITQNTFSVEKYKDNLASNDFSFEKLSETDFNYCEKLGPKNELYIIGGGHCALALSELMSKMDFRISIFDDRPSLNTLDKNEFADQITLIEKYDNIASHIPSGNNVYVVVMTLGYAFDAIAIRKLIDHEVKYLGVLGSKAKMKTLLTALEKEGFSEERLSRIHTPIGLHINSHTPEEIAISIAAEIISIKNS